MTKRPNILFLFSDQHAQKLAGCYGDRLEPTPNIDRLAARGVTFDNAYCAAPICTPSRMSLLTGRWPHEQSCWTLEDQLASDLPTYAHSLGAAGCRTIQVGRMHSVGPDQLHGFSERDIGDCSPNWLGAPRQDLGELTGAQGPSAPRSDADDPTSISITRSGAGQSGYEVVDDATTQAAIARLEALSSDRRAGDETPFLLSVGFILPHCPFVARREDYDRFAGKVGLPERPKPDAANDHPYLAAWRRYTGAETPDDASVIRARTAYYGLVHALDRKIGQILDTLEASGLAENTLVIYASDHGEQAGDRGLWWKNTFYEESVKVPLVMSWPQKLPQGARCGRVVNLIDVGATMIAAGAAQPLPRSNARDLLPLAANPAAPWVDETFSEYVTDLSSAWTGPEATCQRMLRNGRYKYVYISGHRPQLFDMVDDPAETTDLGDHPDFSGVRDWCEKRVMAGWNPDKIRREVDARCAEKAILREWGRATRPQSTVQYEITAADSWLER